VQGLKAYLQSPANRAVLDEHDREHPDARPEPWEIVAAAAEIDGHPPAGRADLVQRAVTELADIVEDPTPDEVPAYAAGLAAAA